MGLSLKTVINHTKDVSQIIPTKHFSAMEDLFSEWLMDSYYDEVNDVLNKLCDGLRKITSYLLQRELIVELNCLDKVTFQINNNFETIDLQFEKQRNLRFVKMAILTTILNHLPINMEENQRITLLYINGLMRVSEVFQITGIVLSVIMRKAFFYASKSLVSL